MLQIRKGIPNTATADMKESVPKQVNGVHTGAESAELINKAGLKALYIINGPIGLLQESRLLIKADVAM